MESTWLSWPKQFSVNLKLFFEEQDMEVSELEIDTTLKTFSDENFIPNVIKKFVRKNILTWSPLTNKQKVSLSQTKKNFFDSS